jgi:hypothetical protein
MSFRSSISVDTNCPWDNEKIWTYSHVPLPSRFSSVCVPFSWGLDAGARVVYGVNASKWIGMGSRQLVFN